LLEAVRNKERDIDSIGVNALSEGRILLSCSYFSGDFSSLSRTSGQRGGVFPKYLGTKCYRRTRFKYRLCYRRKRFDLEYSTSQVRKTSGFPNLLDI